MFRNWKPVIGLLPWPIRNCQLRNTPEHFFHSSTSSKFIITDLDSLFDSLEKTSESDDEWRMSRFKTIKMLSKWFSKRNFQKQSIKFKNRPELVSDGLYSLYHLIFFNQQKKTLFLILIVKSWKTHPENSPKIKFSGLWHRRISGKLVHIWIRSSPIGEKWSISFGQENQENRTWRAKSAIVLRIQSAETQR